MIEQLTAVTAGIVSNVTSSSIINLRVRGCTCATTTKECRVLYIKPSKYVPVEEDFAARGGFEGKVEDALSDRS